LRALDLLLVLDFIVGKYNKYRGIMISDEKHNKLNHALFGLLLFSDIKISKIKM